MLHTISSLTFHKPEHKDRLPHHIASVIDFMLATGLLILAATGNLPGLTPPLHIFIAGLSAGLLLKQSLTLIETIKDRFFPHTNKK